MATKTKKTPNRGYPNVGKDTAEDTPCVKLSGKNDTTTFSYPTARRPGTAPFGHVTTYSYIFTLLGVPTTGSEECSKNIELPRIFQLYSIQIMYLFESLLPLNVGL